MSDIYHEMTGAEGMADEALQSQGPLPGGDGFRPGDPVMSEDAMTAFSSITAHAPLGPSLRAPTDAELKSAYQSKIDPMPKLPKTYARCGMRFCDRGRRLAGQVEGMGYTVASGDFLVNALQGGTHATARLQRPGRGAELAGGNMLMGGLALMIRRREYDGHDMERLVESQTHGLGMRAAAEGEMNRITNAMPGAKMEAEAHYRGRQVAEISAGEAPPSR